MAHFRSRIKFWCLVVVVLGGFLDLVHAHPTSTPTNALESRQNSTNTEPLNCTTTYSSDYYGFGVRLGVYFAWLTSYFANTMLASEISGSLDTNCIFLVALLISLFRGTINNQLYQIDGLILMHLASGFLFSSLSIWGYRTLVYQTDGPRGIRQFGGWGTHGRLALITAISVYGTWFWWEGTEDGLALAQDERCQTLKTWLFATFTVGKGINIYYIMVSLGCSIYFGSMCVAGVFASGFKLFKRGFGPRLRMETGLNETELKILFMIFRLFNIAWIVFCASMIEMTLNRNNMLDTLGQTHTIASPAQLLPFLVGVLGFARVLWLIFKDWRLSIRQRKDDGDALLARMPDWLIKIIAKDAHHLTRTNTEYEEPATKTIQGRYALSWMPWLAEFFRAKRSEGFLREVEVVPLDDTQDTKYARVGQDEVKQS